MAARIRTAAGFLVLLLVALLARPPGTAAAVVVSDQVTSVGRPVFLKAVTRGLIFTRGGQRVSFRIDNAPAYETLSGADGAAFMKYHPDKPGIRTVTAVSEGEEGNGTLLVLAPEASVIVIGIEGGLQKSLYPEKERQAARESLSELSRRFHLVYLTRWIGAGMVKNWLEDNEFPQSVVLRWRGKGVFKQMENRGVQITAVIGSSALLQAAPDAIDKRFTFDENDDAAVSGWEEIRKALQGSGDTSTQPSPGKDQGQPKP